MAPVFACCKNLFKDDFKIKECTPLSQRFEILFFKVSSEGGLIKKYKKKILTIKLERSGSEDSDL